MFNYRAPHYYYNTATTHLLPRCIWNRD